MLKRNQKKRYVLLENSLISKFSHIKENEIEIIDSDFKDGRLRQSSFDRLKDECWYIPYEEPVIVKAPKGVEANFKNDLEFFASRQLSKIKKDRKEARLQGGILFGVGFAILAVLALAMLLWEALTSVMLVTELVTIISWVFVWAGVTKFFIDRKDIVDKRFTILQLLDAKIEYY